mgnify:CR=1 FL=1
MGGFLTETNMSSRNVLQCMEARALFTATRPDVKTVLQRAVRMNQDREDPAFARALCHEALTVFWDSVSRRHGSRAQFPAFSEPIEPVQGDTLECARALGAAAAACPLDVGAYYLSSLYVQCLPELLRGQYGMFFTPPPLVERLLDMIDAAGFDWTAGMAIDPACGGGAFIAPMARRMVRQQMESSSKRMPATEIASRVLERVRGIEIESYCAWMSRVFLSLTLVELLGVSHTDTKQVIQNDDTMVADEELGGRFALVIGNPPYGRVGLPPRLREKYQRSLFGHANLYGVFTHIAIGLTQPGGIIAYVTPTSFLGGQYFRNLRSLLKAEAPLRAIDFVAKRAGVFEGVLQETSLALFQKHADASRVRVHVTTPNGIQGRTRVESLGQFKINGAEDSPWVLPRDKQHSRLWKRAQNMHVRLGDLGYEVCTGPLVWNRHKDQLSDRKTADARPLIWAESVRSNGTFSFAHQKRNHVPYIRLKPGQDHLVTRQGCVLVQRTTAKEQHRRIIAARLPGRFVKEHGGAVIENHLNVVRSANGRAAIDLPTVAALMNSTAIDHLFRCISGSVAVSAYEIGSMPLPDEDTLTQLQELVRTTKDRTKIDCFIGALYGLNT